MRAVSRVCILSGMSDLLIGRGRFPVPARLVAHHRPAVDQSAHYFFHEEGVALRFLQERARSGSGKSEMASRLSTARCWLARLSGCRVISS